MALGGSNQAKQHPHGCRLARAVGAKEPKDFATIDRKREMIDSHHGAVVLGQICGLDGNIWAVVQICPSDATPIFGRSEEVGQLTFRKDKKPGGWHS